MTAENGQGEGDDVFEGKGGEDVDAAKVFDEMMMHNDARGVFQE